MVVAGGESVTPAISSLSLAAGDATHNAACQAPTTRLCSISPTSLRWPGNNTVSGR